MSPPGENLRSAVAAAGPVARKVVVEAGLFLAMIVMLFLFTGWMTGILEGATKIHWTVGGLVAAACCGIVWIALVQLRSRDALRGPIRIAVAGILGSVLVGALVAGWISFVLHGGGIADFGAEPAAGLWEFFGFYLWSFLEMIPALRVTDTLDLSPPLEPDGLAAGLPLLAFRILVVYGVIAGARMWWRMRGDSGS